MCTEKQEGYVKLPLNEYRGIVEENKNLQESLNTLKDSIDNKYDYVRVETVRYLGDFTYWPKYEGFYYDPASKELKDLAESVANNNILNGAAKLELSTIKSKWWYKLFKNW